ncbi:Maf family protein [Pinirhizobacter sp.]|jgi:septum formation protein|uniref:Maf family protein n=1 Tax=Pinirhizobacter sp. TaxID=2950432 RepID=UPI002F406885
MLYLASQSPRRRQLLAQIGFDFEPLDLDIPEARALHETPLGYVTRVSGEKAVAGRGKVSSMDFVLAADTEVVLDDEVFGKPVDDDDAAGMLGRLSGRTHEVISTVWLVGPEFARSVTSTSQVRMMALDGDTIAGYLATGEHRGKAGAYAIQGHAGAFIEHLSGSFTGVMGLPLHETYLLLHAAGIRRAA